MIKTDIKMRVNDEQSKRVQEICFDNGIYWGDGSNTISEVHHPFLFIKEDCIHGFFNQNFSFFRDSGMKEIDADLFIRTNGSCEENLTAKVENFVIKALEDENLLLKKKIENLHIALNKKVEKNKNQKEEITRLFKLNQQYKSGISRLVGYSIDDRISINGYIDFILKQKEGFRESENVLIKMVEELWNIEATRGGQIVSDKNFDNLYKEIDRLNFIIKYLEARLNEK